MLKSALKNDPEGIHFSMFQPSANVESSKISLIHSVNFWQY